MKLEEKRGSIDTPHLALRELENIGAPQSGFDPATTRMLGDDRGRLWRPIGSSMGFI